MAVVEPERYAADLEVDQQIVSKFAAKNFMPDALLVQISRRCNLKCAMCGWSVWARNEGYMSLDLYRRVLSEAAENGIKTIGLSNPQGEPLLSPHAEECITLAVDGGFNVTLNTNCTPLGARNIKVICEAARNDRFSVQASFSGYDKASHEGVYVGSRFEDTAKKLFALNDALKAIGREKSLIVNGIITDASSVEQHLRFLEGGGIGRSRVAMSYPDNFAGIVSLGTEQNALGISTFKKNLDGRGLRLCTMMMVMLLVYDDGKVSACSCRDSEGVMEIGDLVTQSLMEIRTGDKFAMMVKSFMTRDLTCMPLCRKCDVPYGDGWYPAIHYYTDQVYA